MNIEKYKYVEGDIQVDVPITEGNVFLNATETYKSFGKSKQAFDKWKQRTLEPYAERLIELDKIPSQQNVDLADLVIVKQGGNDPQQRGTWLHPKLAVVFARWLSMDFEIWCDEKIDELLNKGYAGVNDAIGEVLDDIAPQIKEIKRYVRKTGGGMRMNKLVEVLSSMENASHTLNDYRTVLSGITSASSTVEREKVYNKLIKGAYKSFEDGKISRRTLEDVLQILNSNLIKLLRRRQTDLVNKLTEKGKVDITKYIDEIEQLKSKLEELEGQLDDPRPVKFELRTLHMLKDRLDASKKINESGYKELFNSILEEDGNKPGPKYPDWKGDNAGPNNQIGAGIWINDGYYYCSVGTNRKPFAVFCKLELYQSPGDEDVYVGTDNVKRHFATFNHVTGNLIVYRKK